MQCEEMEYYLDDTVYRLKYAVALIDRIINRAGYASCTDRSPCLFIQDMDTMADMNIKAMQNVQRAGNFKMRDVPRIQLPTPRDEPNVKQLIYMLTRDFRQQLANVAEDTAFLRSKCTNNIARKIARTSLRTKCGK